MTLELQRFDDLDAFRRETDGYLLSHIEDFSHLYGQARALTPEKVADYGLWLARLHRQGVTCGVAAIAIPMSERPLSITDLDDDAAALVAASLAADGPHFDGIIGTVEAAERMARHLGMGARLHMRMGNHVLDCAPVIPECAGNMRTATTDDFDLVLAWEKAFVDECGLPYDPVATAASVRERVQGPAPREWLWVVDGRPVAKTMGRPLDHFARIAQVYSAPEQRGRGYAGALVGTLCKQLQAQGCRLIFLNTDMANRTSNSVYRRIGFRLVSEILHLDLQKKGVLMP
ncbi:MAG TPA: GNAT family N-acetyltransferase [Burkholderiaceae bacterium]|jgi:predicted GNAT family acetyltransferase